jgi:hypothetical protein
LASAFLFPSCLLSVLRRARLVAGCAQVAVATHAPLSSQAVCWQIGTAAQSLRCRQRCTMLAERSKCFTHCSPFSPALC